MTYEDMKTLFELGYINDVKKPNRDQLAAMAMQGILASPQGSNMSSTYIATSAYTMADAMLKARSGE